jgi:hypothetical protein
LTITLSENIESCNSILAALPPLGMSNAIVPWTVLPGLMSWSHLLFWPLTPPRSRFGGAVGAELAARGVVDTLRGVVQGLALAADVGDLQRDDQEPALRRFAQPELGVANAAGVTDLGDNELKFAVAYLVADPGTELPAPCAAALLPVPVLAFVPVPLPLVPPPRAAATMVRTTMPPTMPSVIFSPRRRLREAAADMSRQAALPAPPVGLVGPLSGCQEPSDGCWTYGPCGPGSCWECMESSPPFAM